MKEIKLPFSFLFFLDFEEKRDLNDNLFFNGFCPLMSISLSDINFVDPAYSSFLLPKVFSHTIFPFLSIFINQISFPPAPNDSVSLKSKKLPSEKELICFPMSSFFPP